MPETGDVLSILHKDYGWGSIWDRKTPELENKVESREANKKFDADTRKQGFERGSRVARILQNSRKDALQSVQIAPMQRWPQKSGFLYRDFLNEDRKCD